MINFKQRVQITIHYHEWLKAKNETLEGLGYAIKDTGENFLVFLSEAGLLKEEAIDENYPKQIIDRR